MNNNSKFFTEAVSQACPACGYQVAIPFLVGSQQPLATIAWPQSSQAAQDMEKLPLEFYRCVDCGHVYNHAFSYEVIPYSKKPNLMFNQGVGWSIFIKGVYRSIFRRLPPQPTVVEIGHGDGSFLKGLANHCSRGTFIGFDPNSENHQQDNTEFRREYFDPIKHAAEIKPDLIVSRHVLEHFTNPLGFLQSIAYASRCIGIEVLAYFEVPCIDQAIESNRTSDFYYEHNSHFTNRSFNKMLGKCSDTVLEVGHGYGGEVVYGIIKLRGDEDHLKHVNESYEYQVNARTAHQTICGQLDELFNSGLSVCIWGGTGKSAALMNRYGIDAVRFPFVVDSDMNKVGTFVPGTGQQILDRSWLVENPVQVIIIPTQWRAHDIFREITEHNIPYNTIYIEHAGRLVDYLHDKHPYPVHT